MWVSNVRFNISGHLAVTKKIAFVEFFKMPGKIL